MSAPRTNAAIADDLERWFREVHETLPPTPARHAIEALRKEPPAPHFSLQEREITQAEADALDRIAAAPSRLEGVTLKRVPLQPPALPAEVEAVLAKLNERCYSPAIDDCLNQAMDEPCLDCEAATLLRRYAQAVAEKDGKLQAVEALCEVQSCETEPDRRYVADRVLAILREEH